MGQVWRAMDTTLGRQVAIKILPEGFAADPERLARFEREAKTLACLNHPHIAAIYGFEKSGGTHALVMELVEGEDLSVRIARGPIPLDEAMSIARQIAYALEAAHDQGIVHRDLKPANIKLRSDGTVKVLDFGLAKATEQHLSTALSPDIEMSPTITMTKAGVILGTAAYMSPEQARGKTVGKRADIWAFGAVLFEMVTGRRPFEGEDSAEILGAVVRLEPPWEALPSDVRPAVRTLLHACLVKDPRHRVADISVALFVMDQAASLGAAAMPEAPAPLPPSARLPWIGALAVAVLAIVAMAVPLVSHLREPSPAALPELRTDIVTPATDIPSSFALSPDGRQIVFVATGEGASRLWLRSLTTTTAQALAGTEGASFPFWSPDGRSVAFFSGVALKRLDLDGGAPQSLVQVSNAVGGTWNADGVILFTGLGTPVMRVAASGGPSTSVTNLGPQQQGHYAPYFLPDGKRFLFYVGGTTDTTGIYLASIDGGAPTRLTSAEKAGVYYNGWLLWVRGGVVVAQRLDVANARLVGDVVVLAEGGAVDSYARSAVSVSATGLVAYRTGTGSQRQLTWVDRTGTLRATLGDPDGNELLNPRVSPDGKRVLVERTVSNRDLWMLDGGRSSRFTFDPASDRLPVWSPDGRRIAFNSSRSGQYDLYVKRSDGAGGEELLVASHQTKAPTSWSPDGRFLMYHSVDPQLTGSDIWIVPMVGEHTPTVFLKTRFNEAFGAFSPDGRWVAYHSNESGQTEIYIRPFVAPTSAGTAAEASGAQWQVSTNGGIHPAWRSDGKELYFLNPAGQMMAAPIAVSGNTLATGTPVVLFQARIFGGGVASPYGMQYDVAPDGRFLINTVLDTPPAPIRLLMNWNPDARK